MRGRYGFTLIELLVVIAIIAILAAILFPIFIAAKETGKQAKCAANLMNISRALQMYRDDNDGANCGIWQARTGNLTYDRGSFYFVITRYVGQKLDQRNDDGEKNNRDTVYKCPSAPWLKQKWVDSNASDKFPQTNEGYAYSMNETGWTDSKYRGIVRDYYPGAGIKDSSVRRPSKLIFVAESMGWVGYGVGYGNGSIIDNEKPIRNRDGWISINPPHDEIIPLSQQGYLGKHHGSKSKIYNIRVSHSMGAMLLFYDGHSELCKVTKGINWTLF